MSEAGRVHKTDAFCSQAQNELNFSLRYERLKAFQVSGLARARAADPQIRSLVLCSGAAICLIIPCSSAPTLSNNIIQKGLAFGRDWSGSVVNSGR